MERKRLLKYILLFVMALLSCSGCWDAIDINDRNVITAVVVDKTDYGYVLYLEIAPISGAANDDKGSPKRPAIVKAEGRTLSEAREELDRRMDKPIFLGSVQTVILSEKLARYDIEEYLQRLRQIPDYRKTAHVVVTTADPEKLLADIPANAETIGFSIEQTLTGLINTGQLYHIALMDILQRLSSSYKQYLIPTIDLIDQEPCFTGFSVFSGGMKTGFIPAEECKSIVFMQAEKPVAYYTVPYDDTYATVEVRLKKKKVMPYYREGRISVDLALGFQASLLYPEKGKPVTDRDMAVVQATLQAMLEKEFSDMFTKSQAEYKYDVFRLRSPFRIAYPEEEKKMNWSIEYPKVTLNLSISVELNPNEVIDYQE